MWERLLAGRPIDVEALDEAWIRANTAADSSARADMAANTGPGTESDSARAESAADAEAGWLRRSLNDYLRDREDDFDAAADRLGGARVVRDLIDDWAYRSEDVYAVHIRTIFVVERLLAGRPIDVEALDEAWIRANTPPDSSARVDGAANTGSGTESESARTEFESDAEARWLGRSVSGYLREREDDLDAAVERLGGLPILQQSLKDWAYRPRGALNV